MENNITSFAKVTKPQKVKNLPAVSGKSFIGDKMNITEDMLIAARNGIEKLFELNNDELRLPLTPVSFMRRQALCGNIRA